VCWQIHRTSKENVVVFFAVGPTWNPLQKNLADSLWQLVCSGVWIDGKIIGDTVVVNQDNDELPYGAQYRRTLFVLASLVWSFMQQKITVRRQESVDRPMRRRLEREGYQHTPLIEVVELRAKKYESHPDDGYVRESTPIDWSCRWIVRRHIRNHWCPAEGRHKPIWIEPYIKGPEDKPLKSATKLFAVVR
jgi:hypothetical protein